MTVKKRNAAANRHHLAYEHGLTTGIDGNCVFQFVWGFDGIVMLRLLAAIGILVLIIIFSYGRRAPQEEIIPIALWQHRDETAQWTSAAIEALKTHGSALPRLVPGDIEDYCPAYPEAGEDARRAFWVTFLSALAKHESTWQPDAVGGNGAWHGLLQIAPATAKGYGCKATTANALHDGALNLSCGIRIMAVTVPRDQVISRDMRGVAADWGPFHQERKRNDIQQTTRSQSYCTK